MACFTYLLYSNNHNRFYKGHCQSPEERLRQHNHGFTKSTKPLIPCEVVYLEEFQHREEAINRKRIYREHTQDINPYK
ncbi:MAG: GIY-YIG nuclease family protein [Bacteroidia bacterium]|nr:GIY-YIG nuclease family protein [Bacteroidia bacterium]